MALRAGRVGVRPDQVDAQGYIIGSGGGGGGSKFKRTLLADTISDNVVTLSESYKNYDLILLIGSIAYQGVTYYFTTMYDAQSLAKDDGIGTWSDGNSLNLKVSSETTFTKITGAQAFVAVYGYKF